MTTGRPFGVFLFSAAPRKPQVGGPGQSARTLAGLILNGIGCFALLVRFISHRDGNFFDLPVEDERNRIFVCDGSAGSGSNPVNRAKVASAAT